MRNPKILTLAYLVKTGQPHYVQAEWDSHARVWVASSEDVPGLVTEADNIEALDAKLQAMVPELLELNALMP